MKCMICGKICKSLLGLRRHLTSSHSDIPYKDYYDKFLLKGDENICKIGGCKNKAIWKTKLNKYLDFCPLCIRKKTLEAYVIRYGEEEGYKRFKEFKETNSNAKKIENFIRLYGKEEGTIRYNLRYKVDDSKCNLNGFIIRYGEEEGTKRYNEYCSSVGTSLENLQRIYGEEEGAKRYETFCSNTGITLEKLQNLYGNDEGTKRHNLYIERLRYQNTKQRYKDEFGDRWEEEWNKTQSNKGTSLENFQRLYGEEEGQKRYDSLYKDTSKRTSLEGFIIRYGKEEGTKRFKKYCEDLSYKNSEDYYIEKYGKDDGIRKYYIRHNNPYAKTSLQGYILRHGEELGTFLYNKRSKWIGSSKKKFIERDGQILGVFKYERYVKRVKRRLRNKLGSASKESMNVFFPLMDWLLDKKFCTLDEIYVGIKGSKEWCLNGKKDKDIEKVYFYDFTIPKFKIIIEYNGETYHPNPTWDNQKWNKWTNPYTKKSADEVFMLDSIKNKFAKTNGFKLLELWSSDSLQFNINRCKEFILKEKRVNETYNRDII